MEKEEHEEKGYWGESLGTRRQQWREKRGGSGSENAAVSSLCSVFAPPCLLCCFCQLALLLECVTHTQKMYTYAEIFHAVFVLRLSEMRLFATNVTNPFMTPPAEIKVCFSLVVLRCRSCLTTTSVSVYFLPRFAWEAFWGFFPTGAFVFSFNYLVY